MNFINQLLPSQQKQKFKARVLNSLSAEPEIVARMATRVIKVGVSNYLNWNYREEKQRILAYLEQRRTTEFEFRFSASSTMPTLYASIYACMLLGLLGELDYLSLNDKRRWLDYFDQMQSESDGYFRDPVLAGNDYEIGGMWGDGWGIRHLAGHIIIAYGRLGGQPRYPFKFLSPFYDDTYLEAWLGKFRFTANVWSASNYIMNLYSLLQYARDFMGEQRAAKPVDRIAGWMTTLQSPETGMWHNYSIQGYPELGDAIRGAYHFYPLFTYEQRPVAYREKVIDQIIKSQNSWGGFETEKRPSGACEDIDALEPLIRFVSQTGYRRSEADLAIKRAFVWLLAHRHADGGYESLMENGCHYGGHPQTESHPRQSNLFATWFRTLTLAYVTRFLNMENGYDISRFPGYEIAL